jgi:hypothetical protein
MLHLLRFLGSRFQVDLIAPALDGAEDRLGGLVGCGAGDLLERGGGIGADKGVGGSLQQHRAALFIGQLVALMPWWYIYLVLLMIRPAMWVSGIKPEGISWRDLRSYWRVVGVPTEHGQAIRRFRAFRARNDSELGFTCEVLPETLELKKHWARLKSFLRSLQARGLRLFARGDVSL